MKNKYGELATNTVIFACASLCSKVVMFFLLPIYTNVLSKEEYGIVELIISGINLLTPIITLSITDAILRFGLDKNLSSERVMKASLVFLSLASFLMIICTPLVRLYRPLREYSSLFTLTLIVFMFRSAITFYLKSLGKNLLFAIDTILYTLLLALLNIFFLIVLKKGTEGYILSLVIASLVSCIFCIVVSGKWKELLRCPFDVNLLMRMLIYSSPLILNAVSWWLTNSSDKYMLEYICSEAEVGLYSAAAKIPALLSAVNSLFSQAWTLSSVKEYDSTADRSFFANIFRMFATIMIFACAVLLLVIKPFMSIYVGLDFREAWKYVPILLIATLFGSLSSFFGAVYVATKKNVRCTTSTLICGITNIFLNFVLIPKMGIMGAVIATAISYIVIGIYRMLDCQRTFFFKINYLQHGLGAVIVIIQAGVVTWSEYRYMVSILCIVALGFIYKQSLHDCLLFIKKRVKRKIVNGGR